MKKIIFCVVISMFLINTFTNDFSSKILIKNGEFISTSKIINIPKKTTLSVTDKISLLATGKKNDKFSFIYKEEHLIRRAEILFFGSLTFSTFLGWLVFSAYNSILYEDTFGQLKRYQFLTLYIGGGIIAFSVSLSDLLVRIQPFFKRVEFY